MRIFLLYLFTVLSPIGVFVSVIGFAFSAMFSDPGTPQAVRESSLAMYSFSLVGFFFVGLFIFCVGSIVRYRSAKREK